MYIEIDIDIHVSRIIGIDHTRAHTRTHTRTHTHTLSLSRECARSLSLSQTHTNRPEERGTRRRRRGAGVFKHLGTHKTKPHTLNPRTGLEESADVIHVPVERGTGALEFQERLVRGVTPGRLRPFLLGACRGTCQEP